MNQVTPCPNTLKSPPLESDPNIHINLKSKGYIIAPNENMNRKTMYNFLSKSFSHFWSLSGNERMLKLNDLRNTYISNLYLKYGDRVKIISNHSSVDVIKKHHLDNTLHIDVSKDFSVLE